MTIIDFIFILMWGFVLGKLIPLSADSWRKWWYNRRGIAYYLTYILEGGKIIHKGMIKQTETTFKYKTGTYVTFKTDVLTKRPYSPYIELDNQKILFYNKNNTNPLEFRDLAVIPSHNDPVIFQSIIEDNTVRQALADPFDIGGLKRFILVALLISVGCSAGIMYMLLGM